jgi:hypothetical protein
MKLTTVAMLQKPLVDLLRTNELNLLKVVKEILRRALSRLNYPLPTTPVNFMKQIQDFEEMLQTAKYQNFQQQLCEKVQSLLSVC